MKLSSACLAAGCRLALLLLVATGGLARAAEQPAASSPAAVEESTAVLVDATGLRFSYVSGAGGVPLSVAQAGDAQAPGILFIHGLGQSHVSFTPQLHGSLPQRFHLVAFDLRGHGNSGKPWDEAAYSDGNSWAEDVHEVMAATGLDRPLIVAWSYGTLITSDYIRRYGTEGLAGVVMIGALGGLASLPLKAFDPAVLAKMSTLRELSASPGLENTLAASREVVTLLTARPMSAEWTAVCETMNALVPPFARRALVARMTMDNRDLIPRIRVPMLLLGGSEDHGVPEPLMRQLSGALPLHADVKVYQGSGHSPFAEEPARFNDDLNQFANRVFTTR